MRSVFKGIVVGVAHLAIVGSVGAKFLLDRSSLPRVWVRTAPYDPETPIRGRYVSLQVVVEPRDAQGQPADSHMPRGTMPPVRLIAEGEHLVAQLQPPAPVYRSSDLHLHWLTQRGEPIAVLDKRVAYFIPERAQDPSRREGDEQLWVEATIPRSGPPRPIRLGVKKGDGPITPIDLD